jgi:L,D-peptidoglycan transpeptidase YkuD (ErfK/YbiS/YcfS/YnhG family)
VTPTWTATDAHLQRWQRDDAGTWRPAGAPVPAVVGRSGFGWGLGLHALGVGPRKREGDGRSPAGVFVLGEAFGYAPKAPPGVRVAYRSAGARDYFVDDAASADYNRWRRIPESEPNEPRKRWQSFERMRRDDDVYELGAVVQHNPRAVPNAGSAIFLHCWSEPGAPTSGCTAVARADLLSLLEWLDPDAAPVVVQGPAAVLRGMQLR